MSLCKSLAEPAASLTARRTRQIDEGEEHGADLLPGRVPMLRNALATPTIAGFCPLQGQKTCPASAGANTERLVW